jgi:hypothetical protein
MSTLAFTPSHLLGGRRLLRAIQTRVAWQPNNNGGLSSKNGQVFDLNPSIVTMKCSDVLPTLMTSPPYQCAMHFNDIISIPIDSDAVNFYMGQIKLY